LGSFFSSFLSVTLGFGGLAGLFGILGGASVAPPGGCGCPCADAEVNTAGAGATLPDEILVTGPSECTVKFGGSVDVPDALFPVSFSFFEADCGAGKVFDGFAGDSSEASLSFDIEPSLSFL